MIHIKTYIRKLILQFCYWQLLFNGPGLEGYRYFRICWLTCLQLFLSDFVQRNMKQTIIKRLYG